MERVGAPPGVIDTYASLLREAFPLVDSRGRVVATASAAGVPRSWAVVVPQTRLHPFSENPLSTLNKLSDSDTVTLLFLVPQRVLAAGSLSVRIAGDDHRLSEIDEDAAHDIALMYVTVGGDVANHVGSTALLWLTLPATQSHHWPLVLLRRDPRTVSSTGFAFATAASTAGLGDGDVSVRLPALAAGSPVVAVRDATAAVIGFVTVDSGGSNFVGTPRIAEFARQAIVANTPAAQGAPTLGITVETASIAHREDRLGYGGPGVLVTRVGLRSATEAGLHVGDVVTAYDGALMDDASALIARVRAGAAGTQPRLTVRHGATVQTLRVTLAPS